MRTARSCGHGGRPRGWRPGSGALRRAGAYVGGALILSIGFVRPLAPQTPGDRLTVPAGFRVTVFAEGLQEPRWMAFGPDGALYVTLPDEGRVVRIHDRDGDGRADSVETVAEGLKRPHGLGWRDRELWVAEMTRVVRLADADGPARPTLEVVVSDLPADGHWTRTLAFEPGGRGFLLSIGSSCNVCVEDDPRRAAVVRYDWDGSGERVWASGLRNAVGLIVHPETGELWATDNGRDRLGDDLPPEELNVLVADRDYGWPYCYGNRVPNPEYADRGRCGGTEPPVLTFPAHTAPLGLAYYDGAMFPSEYRGDLFVALHGSWNRSAKAGYKVVRVRMAAGRPSGETEDFVTGWLTDRERVWGRPVQPLVGPDGALYVSDDLGGRVWRVWRPGNRRSEAGY